MARRDGKWWRARLRNVTTIYVIYLALLFALQRIIVFPRWSLHIPDDAVLARNPDLVRLTLPKREGHVEAWFLPGKGASPEHPKPAVIYAHGNGELIDDWVLLMQSYRDLGVSVLLPEFRG